jgi:predicted deacylase
VTEPIASDRLDLSLVPRGTVGRQLVPLAEDAMGRPIRVPLLIARGKRDGPVLGITAALHGNEINGIPVLHKLFADIDAGRLRGTVVGAVVVNVPGFLDNTRWFHDGTDLNHRFPGLVDGDAPRQYAHRILDRLVRDFDYLVDLHTASFGRINSLYIRADLRHPVTSRMARLLRPELLLHNPAADKTLRGAAMELGIPAITVEIGNPQRFQQRYIRRTLQGLRALLGDLGLLAKKRYVEGAPPVVCRRSGWLYTSSGGLLTVLPELLDRVERGEPIARMTNIFGDRLEEFLAPSDGVVIGRSVNPVGGSGARILHLGEFATEADGFLGAEPRT